MLFGHNKAFNSLNNGGSSDAAVIRIIISL